MFTSMNSGKRFHALFPFEHRLALGEEGINGFALIFRMLGGGLHQSGQLEVLRKRAFVSIADQALHHAQGLRGMADDAPGQSKGFVDQLVLVDNLCHRAPGLGLGGGDGIACKCHLVSTRNTQHTRRDKHLCNDLFADVLAFADAGYHHGSGN